MERRFSKTLKAFFTIVVVLVAIVTVITITGLIADKAVSGLVAQAGEDAQEYFAHMVRDDVGNAWDYYERAIEVARSIDADAELIAYLEGEEEPTLKIMQTVMDNPGIIQYLEEGARQEYCMLPHEYERGLESPLPEYIAFRRAVTIVCAKALHDLENGKSDEALALLFTTIMVGKHVASSPMIIDHMIGFALVGRSMKVLRLGIASRAFDRQQLGEIAEFLDDLDKHWPMLTDAIMGDINLMRISFASYGERATSLLIMGDESTERLGFTRMLALRMLCWRNWFSPLRAIHSSLSFFEELEDELRSYEQVLLDETASSDSVQHRWRLIESRMTAFKKRNFWFALSCPEYNALFRRKVERLTMIRMLGLASSLAAHREREGGFPEKLTEVAPHLVVDLRTGKPWEYNNYGDSAGITSPDTDGLGTLSVTVTRMGIEEYLERLRRRAQEEKNSSEEKK